MSRFTEYILMALCALLIIFLALPVNGTVPGLRLGITFNGYDPTGGPGGPPGAPFTYVPIIGNTGFAKSEYVDAVVKGVDPLIGRDMDWKQLVTNDMTNWSDQLSLANDYGRNGMRETTVINISNQFLAKIPDYTPQIGIPLMSTRDYAKQQGKLWAQQFKGHKVEINLGDEVWNVFAGNLGAWNLNQAHIEGYQGDDFRVLGLRQGFQLAEHYKGFAEGWVEGGGNAKDVTLIIEGFAPITQYVQNQLDGMKLDGFDPSKVHTKLSIAQYDAGSSSDLTGDLSTPAKKESAVNQFVDTALVKWSKQHHDLAIANGLDPHVDGYEMKIGTYPTNDANSLTDWVNFQNTDNAERLQERNIPLLVDASGGIGSILNVEGYGGFPMGVPQGQFPMVDINQMFDHPEASGVYRGIQNIVDFNSVPEPTVISFVFILGIVYGFAWRHSTFRRAA